MDGAAISVMTGGTGLLAVAAVTRWVTKRMHPTGAVRNVWICLERGDMAVVFKAKVVLLR
jgi:hypothetical protein